MKRRFWQKTCAFFRADEPRCILSWYSCRICPYRVEHMAELNPRDHVALVGSRINFRTMVFLSILATLVSLVGLYMRHSEHVDYNDRSKQCSDSAKQ